MSGVDLAGCRIVTSQEGAGSASSGGSGRANEILDAVRSWGDRNEAIAVCAPDEVVLRGGGSCRLFGKLSGKLVSSQADDEGGGWKVICGLLDEAAATATCCARQP
jgi:hypothetical protein